MYDGENIIAEISDSGETIYLRDNTGIVSRTRGNAKEYFVSNYRGDISAVVNSNADIIKSYDYEAFGSLKNASAEDDNPFRYCGEYFDDETGFVYLRNRYYDPSIGRFTTEDPAKSGLNWYAYCENNPVNRIDPSGLTWEEYDAFLPKWARNRIEQLTLEYYAAGDSVNEYGMYIRDDFHNEAIEIRLQFVENTYLNYAVKDFKTFDIDENNYLDMLGFWDEDTTYTQAIYTYAIELQNSSSTKYMVRNSDGSLSNEWLNAVRILGGTNGTPKNNQAQNKQARAAAKKYNLSKEGQRALHDEISKQGLGYDEIMEVAKSIADLGGKYVK